jgi:hypothetical protein
MSGSKKQKRSMDIRNRIGVGPTIDKLAKQRAESFVAFLVNTFDETEHDSNVALQAIGCYLVEAIHFYSTTERPLRQRVLTADLIGKALETIC